MRRYVELRSGKALYFGAAHEDKEHVHLHLMVSSIETFTGKSISMRKEAYQNLKLELQAYEKELGLSHSEVDHGKGMRRKTDRERHLEERTGKASRKEEIRGVLERSFSEAMSRGEFYENVKNCGLKLYERGGRTSGVDDNRHYRFETLEFGEGRMRELDEREERERGLTGIRGGGRHEIEFELEDGEMRDDPSGESIQEQEKDETKERG